MLRVSRLLEIDAQYRSEQGIKECLGDQYLYSHNWIFKKVRDQAIESGVVYSASDSPLWRDYQVCSLFCLQSILDRKIIPFIDNASSLGRLVANVNQDFAIDATLLLQIVKRNFLLHESAHCVANFLMSGLPRGESVLASEGEFAVCRAILAEAFATAIERSAFAVAGTDDTHLLYFNLNSHVDYHPDKRSRLVKAIRDFGLKTTFKLGLISLFINNMARRALTQAEIDSIITYCVPEYDSELYRPDLSLLILKSFTISDYFLQVTTPAYFRLMKLESEFLRLGDGRFSAKETENLAGVKALNNLINFLPNECGEIPTGSR